MLRSGRSLNTTMSNIIKLAEIIESVLLLILPISFLSFALSLSFFGLPLGVHLLFLCDFSFAFPLELFQLTPLLGLFLLLLTLENDLALVGGQMLFLVHQTHIVSACFTLLGFASALGVVILEVNDIYHLTTERTSFRLTLAFLIMILIVVFGS